MQYQVIFRAAAQLEAVEAAGYIADQGYPDTALQWYEGLKQVIESLQEMPKRYALAREDQAFAAVELRQVVYKSYRLIFTVRGDTVHVLHVRHVAQANLNEIALDE